MYKKPNPGQLTDILSLRAQRWSRSSCGLDSALPNSGRVWLVYTGMATLATVITNGMLPRAFNLLSTNGGQNSEEPYLGHTYRQLAQACRIRLATPACTESLRAMLNTVHPQ